MVCLFFPIVLLLVFMSWTFNLAILSATLLGAFCSAFRLGGGMWTAARMCLALVFPIGESIIPTANLTFGTAACLSLLNCNNINIFTDTDMKGLLKIVGLLFCNIVINLIYYLVQLEG